MEKIIEFFTTLYEQYFYWILAGVVLFALLVLASIIIGVKKHKAKKKQQTEAFIKESVQTLTPEEIENISNNSSNPVVIKQTLTAEVTEAQAGENGNSTQNTSVQETTEVPLEPQSETTPPQTEEVAVAQEEKPVSKPRKKKVKPVVQEPEATSEVPAEPQPEATPPQTEEVAVAQEEKPVSKPRKKKVKPAVQEPETVADAPVVAPAETPVEKPVETTEETPTSETTKKVYVGKWKIKDDENGFYACLTASNGVLVLRTEYYKSLSGVKNGIETIKKNIEAGNFAISADKYGHYRYKLLSKTSKPLCISEDYSSKAKCESGIESVKRFANSAIIIREEK